eukprot:CAMPEP_0202695090 /NCGR_PEP_ID=MMETSP1385-20130828/8771_1 /ASSEMBLY_ACC=CAM_ASM_000861 /TAXON_ID=933848 /ORGANISM="Elphidium margaritaceum" /LENGTH=545 /DNA_ID=CAMNT_0049351053 /DNA_START=24 /DNA_END=1661 /DNA_ORIENTATION=+
MSTILKSCGRLGIPRSSSSSPLKLHIIHDIRQSHLSYCVHFKHRYRLHGTYHNRFTFATASQQSQSQKEDEEQEESDTDSEEISANDGEADEDDDEYDDDDEQDEEGDDVDDEDELTESQKFLIQYRKSQGLHYTPKDDSEFRYKPIPRVPGPSPFVNHDYKRPSVARYPSIQHIELPVSSMQPLGGNPEIWIHNSNATKKAIYKLSPDIFNQDVRVDLLWRCVRYEQHKKKHFTWHLVKHRGEIKGSGKKKRPQKGTGKSRQSDFKAPHCIRGGKAHGRRPRSVETQLKKMIYWKGIKVALTARYQEGDLYLWEDFVLPRLQKPDYLRNIELYESEQVNKHAELGDALVPVEELDWNDNTKLYYDVYKTRQMLNKWGWLKPQLHARCNNNKVFNKILSAKRTGNIVDILEAMPISDFQWDFLKEEDQLVDQTIPTVLLVHDGYLHRDFVGAVHRTNGLDLMCWDEIVGEYKKDMGVWRHIPKMGVNRLLKYKKIVFSVNALKLLQNAIGIEAEVERWNYYAELNRIRQDDEKKDAFPKQKQQIF